jgi:MSHA biogenesis protein MshI
MALFSSSAHKPGWLAILSREKQLTLAHAVRRPGRHPEITGLETFAVEGWGGSGDDKGNVRADALLRLKSPRQLKSYRCTTLMAEGEYQITQFDTPSVPGEERKEALRWLLRGQTDYPVEKACLGVLDIPGDGLPGRGTGVLVISAAESQVSARAAPFEAAGVPLAVIDVPELAQRNIAALLEDENRGLVFLHISETGNLLTLTYRGELVAARRGEITTRQMLANDTEQRVRSRERLVLEMQRSLDNFDRQYSHISISRMLLATYPRIEGLVAELAKNVYVPVQEMNLAAAVDFPNVPELRDPAFQARNLLVIGAALRSEEAST